MLLVSRGRSENPDVESPLQELRIRLLGGLDLWLGDEPVRLESGRAESLISYLALHGRAPQRRDHLAFLLWPDSSEPQARTNLRHLIHTIRRALPELERFLDFSPLTVGWRQHAPLWFDVAAFEDAASAAHHEPSDTIAPLQHAVELYAGELLSGSYEEWAVSERERLGQLYRTTLERLTQLLEDRHEYGAAIPYAERLLRHDPLREETYRLLMRLHRARGDTASALRVYHACVTALDEELGVAPSTVTRDEYETLLPGQRAESAPAAGSTGATLVGRASEWALLTTRWREIESGESRMALITGEPGIGKSRLLAELRTWCAHRGAVTAYARSYAAEGNLAYGPVVSWLRSEAFSSQLKRLGSGHRAELAHLLPELQERSAEPLAERADSEQRQRLFEALSAPLYATDAPVLLVLDDLQWCDDETLRFLHYLVRAAQRPGLLVGASARMEEVGADHRLRELMAGLEALERFTHVELSRLGRDETAALATQLKGTPMNAAAVARLHQETEGNPLFVIEAMRAGWSEPQGIGWLTPKIQSVIQQRLARLSQPARELVGVAATSGRGFTTDLLAEVAELDEEALIRGLDELWRRGIIRDQGTAAYDFTHDKIREVAYKELSPARRSGYHRRLAHALERIHAIDPSPVSSQLAAHYDLAGDPKQAARWYGQAALAAARVFAHAEAIRLLDRGLELVGRIPADRERAELELNLLTAGLVPLAATEGSSSSRLIATQERCFALESELGQDPTPPLLRSAALTNLVRGRFGDARHLGDRLLARGNEDGDEVLAVEGRYVLGISAFWKGELHAAREHFEGAIDRYSPEHRALHIARYGQDPEVVCMGRVANTLWYLGFPDEANAARDRAVQRAEEIGHPYTRVTALVFAALLDFERGDDEAFRQVVESIGRPAGRAPDLSREGMTAYLQVLDGRPEAGLRRLRAVVEEGGRAQPAPGLRAWAVRLLLEACLQSGDAAEGLAVTEWALPEIAGVRLWEAEIHRLRAAFLAALAAPTEQVDAELQRALEVARRQGARAFELRAAQRLQPKERLLER